MTYRSSNVRSGSRFEREFAKLLSDNGFWVHLLARNIAGQQPADIIAMYHGGAYLIDCKVCENDRFPFSRVEENQRWAMKKWLEAGGTSPQFALKGSTGSIWMLNYEWVLIREEAGDKSVSCAKDRDFLIPFEEWLVNVT